MKHIQHISITPTKKTTNYKCIPLNVHQPETTLPMATRRTPAQLRKKQMPHATFIFKQNRQDKYPSPLCTFAEQNHTLIPLQQTRISMSGICGIIIIIVFI